LPWTPSACSPWARAARASVPATGSMGSASPG